MCGPSAWRGGLAGFSGRLPLAGLSVPQGLLQLRPYRAAQPGGVKGAEGLLTQQHRKAEPKKVSSSPGTSL